MDAVPQILVEPGNPFGFDAGQFDELTRGLRAELGPSYDVRVAYRAQAGAGVTLYEVIHYWIPWEAVKGALAAQLIKLTVDWYKGRRESGSDASDPRPIWISVHVTGEGTVLREARIEQPEGELQYGPFADEEDRRDETFPDPPPTRPWPPTEADLPRGPTAEIRNRRAMLQALHGRVRENQRSGGRYLVLNQVVTAEVGAETGLNATESEGLFRRLVHEGYVRLRRPPEPEPLPEEPWAEIEYLTDRGLREIGEI